MQIVYLGPSMAIGGTLLNQGYIYSNGLPSNINELIKENSDLRSLFVNVERVGQARADIDAAEKTFLGAAFIRVKNAYMKGGR